MINIILYILSLGVNNYIEKKTKKLLNDTSYNRIVQDAQNRFSFQCTYKHQYAYKIEERVIEIPRKTSYSVIDVIALYHEIGHFKDRNAARAEKILRLNLLLKIIFGMMFIFTKGAVFFFGADVRIVDVSSFTGLEISYLLVMYYIIVYERRACSFALRKIPHKKMEAVYTLNTILQHIFWETLLFLGTMIFEIKLR